MSSYIPLYDDKFNIIDRYMINVKARLPFLDKDDITIIRKMAMSKFIDKEILFHNSYTCEDKLMKSSEFLDDIFGNDIIMNENGVFFKAPTCREEIPPTVDCEIYLGYDRNAKKKLMKYYLDVTKGNDPMKASYNDRAQDTCKRTMNTYYGTLQVGTGPFFNIDLAETITCRGRNMVAVSALTVEGLYGGLKPTSLDGILYYLQYGGRYKSEDFKLLSKCKTYTVDDIIETFKNIKEEYIPIIRKTLKTKSQNELNSIYLRNNFDAWLDVDEVHGKIKKFCDYLKETNSAFLNPYVDPNAEPPKDSGLPNNYNKKIFDYLAEIKEYVHLLHGFMWYQENINRYNEIINNPVELIKDIDRYFVALIDTDSNMIAALLSALSKIFDKYLDHLDFKKLEFTYTNLIAVITDKAITMSMANYTEALQVPQEYRDRVAMKNEYYYSDFCLTSKKKNYAGLMCLKEGVAFPKPKLDVKGLMFIKSVVNENTAVKIENIIENMILRSDTIDLKAILYELENSANELETILRTEEGSSYYTGEKLANKLVNVLPTQARTKSVELYNILDIGSKIIPPTKFYTIKVDLNNASDNSRLARVDVFKKIYEIHSTLRAYTDFNIDKFMKAYSSKVIGDVLDTALTIFNTLLALINEIKSERPDIDLFFSRYLSSNIIEDKEVKLSREDIFYKLMTDHSNDLDSVHVYLDSIIDYVKDRVKKDNNRIEYNIGKKRKHFEYKNMDYSDFTRLSIPEDMLGNLHPFILDVLNTVNDVTSIDNLSALVVANTNVSIMRNNDSRQMISNVLNIY